MGKIAALSMIPWMVVPDSVEAVQVLMPGQVQAVAARVRVAAQVQVVVVQVLAAVRVAWQAAQAQAVVE